MPSPLNFNTTNLMESRLRGFFFYGQTLTMSGVFNIGILASYQTDGVPGPEIVGNGYARQTYTSNTTNWTAESWSSGATYNTTQITFPVCVTADQAWCSGVAIYDQNTGGNMLWCGAATTPKYIGIGDQLIIPISGIGFEVA